jgi:pimeloyl-ACP methyl ester carboxylesterase
MASTAPWVRVIVRRSGWDRCKPLLDRSEAWVFELAAVGIAIDRDAAGGKGAPVGRWSDMDVGTLLLMLGLSYALGLLWYDLLLGKLPQQVWRVAAYPFLGIFVAEALLPTAQFELVPDARHYVMAERPEAVADRIATWLDAELKT